MLYLKMYRHAKYASCCTISHTLIVNSTPFRSLLLAKSSQHGSQTSAFLSTYPHARRPRAPANSTSDELAIEDARSSIIFSANQPAELPSRVSNLTAWEVSSTRMGIRRRFTFRSFAAAWQFMSSVADECKARRHHPSWHNLYNRVTVEWTTHNPLGLSMKDVEMAEICDQIAKEIELQAEAKATKKAS